MVDGSVEVVNWSNARLRIPRGVQFDRPEFRSALDAMAGSLEEVRFRIPPGAVSSELMPDEAQAAYRSSLRATGSWRTSQDGLGATFHDSNGVPVFIEQNGQQVPFRLRFGENPRDPAVLRQGGNYAVVRGAAQAAGVDPTWAARVTGAESGGRIGLTSPKGALGLMQVMPATGQEVAAELGLPFDPARLLNDPAYNAQIGTAYLAKLNRDPRFGGDRALVTAAYNAGPNRVAAWLNAGQGSLPDETVAYVGTVLGGDGRNLLALARRRRAAGLPGGTRG
ncbi:transglycosylase SLT domain-containing protein [Roseomonas sp. 1311]|uniref:Transglycosylase SLT domain-containing protein n=2 Tax=Roseomonas marmotae TaxID=2768161 RepID=A0ABS3K7F0_9PROT|nr:transglycosylase SLT domain-containing protein [Roseomonas marmotae]